VRRDCNVDAYLDTLYKHIDSALSSIGAAVRGVPSNVEDAMALSGGDGLAANVGEGVTLCGGGGRELEEGGGGETCQETNAVAHQGGGGGEHSGGGREHSGCVKRQRGGETACVLPCSALSVDTADTAESSSGLGGTSSASFSSSSSSCHYSCHYSQRAPPSPLSPDGGAGCEWGHADGAEGGGFLSEAIASPKVGVIGEKRKMGHELGLGSDRK
jgi:hypothetical protein